MQKPFAFNNPHLIAFARCLTIVTTGYQPITALDHTRKPKPCKIGIEKLFRTLLKRKCRAHYFLLFWSFCLMWAPKFSLGVKRIQQFQWIRAKQEIAQFPSPGVTLLFNKPCSSDMSHVCLIISYFIKPFADLDPPFTSPWFCYTS